MDNASEASPPRLVVPYQRFAVRMAIGILGVLFAAHAVAAIREIAYSDPNDWHVPAGVAIAVGLLIVQAVHCRAAFTGGARHGWRVALAGQVALTYLPFLAFSESWLRMPGFLAGWCLVLMPAPWAWSGYAAVVGVQLALGLSVQLRPGHVFSTVVWTAMLGLATYGVVRLTAMARDVVDVEVARERERFERDLHDLIGQRLLVIALKSELARRLLESDREQASEQLSMVIEAVRQTQSDVRAVAYGQSSTSLVAELASAKSVLESAGTTCRIDASCRELPSRLGDVLVAVVREGVTNVLRHSTARTCRIRVRERAGWVELVTVNDGARQTSERGPDPEPGSGSGLRNLRERAAMVGGELRAGSVGPDRFRLIVRLPRGPAR